MATIEAGIYARLDAQLTYAIAPGIADADEALPYITYRRSDGDHFAAMGEDITDAAGIFDFECFATTYSGAKTVAVALKAAIKRYSGTSATVVINDVLFLTERDNLAEEGRYSVIQTYRVMYDE